MTLTIDLPPELEKTLRKQASKNGQDVNAFVLQALNEKIAKASTFDEICAPFANAVDAAGIGDEEFDDFFEQLREEVWQAKQCKTP
jgi:hypothetical protein